VSHRLGLGDSLGTALWDEGFLKHRESRALDQAQKLGQLPWSLQLLADQLDRRRLEAYGWIVELVQPALVIGVALAVLYFCLAMFLPLVNLLEQLS
jgi:type II secretory pathway component PulF